MIIEFNSFTKKLTEEKNDVFFRSLLCVAKHCSHGKKFYQIKDFTKKKTTRLFSFDYQHYYVCWKNYDLIYIY